MVTKFFSQIESPKPDPGMFCTLVALVRKKRKALLDFSEFLPGLLQETGPERN
jgi:hypothetical protein